MSFWVYILLCSDNSYYTGHTDNLEERVAKHQTAETDGYTSTRLPVKLVFAEQFRTREEALTCERQIKGWSRKKKEALMRRDWAEIPRLARQGHPSRVPEPALSGGRPSTGSGRTESRTRK
jgi:predicted GIY-YIG superfamily endonuclease